MPGTATLDPDVILDQLIPDLDELREDCHAAIGNRAYNVYTVARSWSGGEVGVGDPTDTETLIVPAPKVWPFTSFKREQEPCGYDMAGAVKLTEWSLTYTQAELLACEAPAGTQHLIKIEEAHGQAQALKYFAHSKSPYPDREKTIGWIVYLELVEDQC